MVRSLQKVFRVILFMAYLSVLCAADFPYSVPASLSVHESTEPLIPEDPPVRRPDVLELKMRLMELGFYKGPLDDVYEPEAWDAVKAFQKSFWLDPTGVVDETTWKALGHGVERINIPAAGPIPQGTVRLEVDTENLILTVYVGDSTWKSYPVAVGKWTSLTPVGEWKIVEMGLSPGGPFGSRWMALDVPWGSYGIHGTNRPWSIGSYASTGCIRMYNEDVEELYDLCEIGTRVKIKGVRPYLSFDAPLRRGSTGPEVVMLQEVLREMGFDPGPCDGRFGERTETCVSEVNWVFGLGRDKEADGDVYTLLGIRGG